ncbi:aminoglycoside phosphotransferase family protein [Mucilaginibacter sp. dw_454]|uniref:phosphotransferase enzyme family protein n=1 Tax=Mucilaginibacter sp. dw_454 TaxID=2720079 RepID=UPI001BD2CFA9|nr:aminoglycoside phosphotransferase family protein [Mucilaginibacter sp. dw_454]
MNTHDFDIAAIALKFQITGEVSEVRNYGNGHINDTFLLKNSNPAGPDYLLQRINHHVFKDVLGLMENIARVTAHLQSKLGADNNQKLLQLIDTKDGNTFYRDEGDNYWRLYFFIPGSKSYDIAETARQAYEAGTAFGRFQSMLSDMDPTLLSETIVDFHNIEKRLKDFHEAVKADKAGRVETVGAEIATISHHEQAMSTINQWGRAGLLPKRITHNDTKLNNVLLDADDNAICVIDLDTVMTGYVASDFGDAIRTITNTAAEDEPDLEKIQVNVDLFRAYTEGYIKTAIGFLTEKEIESLSLGMLLLPYMQGVRFLTDYLQGDTYYKIAYPEHNLTRTKAQLCLFEKLHEKSPELRQIIADTVAANKEILTGINTQLSHN